LLGQGNRNGYECLTRWLMEKYGIGGEEVQVISYADPAILAGDFGNDAVDIMVMPGASWVKLLASGENNGLEEKTVILAESGKNDNPVILISDRLQPGLDGILKAFSVYAAEEKNIITRTYAITGFVKTDR
jgi:ABC-type phosphate/phosphonate transport system substrate-binding protein